MLLFGFHSVTARLKQSPESVKTLYLDRDRVDARGRDLQKLAAEKSIAISLVGGERLDRMCFGKRHQGVVALVEATVPRLALAQLLEEVKDADPPPLLLLLDGVTDPRNLGACLRVADGAGAHAVIAPKDHSCLLTDVVIHTASGAAESVPYILVTNLARAVEDLQIAGFTVSAPPTTRRNRCMQPTSPGRSPGSWDRRTRVASTGPRTLRRTGLDPYARQRGKLECFGGRRSRAVRDGEAAPDCAGVAVIDARLLEAAHESCC
jgi:hypothetical protein